MKFQSEKRELWRYASKNLEQQRRPASGQTKLSLPPHRHLHQRLPQIRYTNIDHHLLQPYANVYASDDIEEGSSLSSIAISTPPPPYCSVLELRENVICQQNATTTATATNNINTTTTTTTTNNISSKAEKEISVSATESDNACSPMLCIQKSGYRCENIGDSLLVDEFSKLNELSGYGRNTYLSAVRNQKKLRRASLRGGIFAVDHHHHQPPATASFAATAAKILRNCCGGGFGSGGSTNNINLMCNNNNNNNACANVNFDTAIKQNATTTNTNTKTISMLEQPEQYFNALMKQLKSSQIALLLKAVKLRCEPILLKQTTAISRNSIYAPQANCILLRRAAILNDEPYVIVCRLFFWRDLLNSSQLKRLPDCPNERDPVYICCNPLHWYRIIETEMQLPGYSNQRMDRMADCNFVDDDEENSTCTIGGHSECCDSKYYASKYGGSISTSDPYNPNTGGGGNQQIPESLTTDGEDDRYAPNWCEIAYWEMAKRVGDRCPAITSTINVYGEMPLSSGGEPTTNMCLRDLVDKRKSTSTCDDIQNTRQKIGLGVTLCQEADGVWLYNRSMVPIFIYSPTLMESWFRVFRLEPGECILAFDSYRAKSLVYSTRFHSVQTGPIDTFSMRISFGKGWGYSYKRPDITRCPCWLEVLFTRQR